MSTNRTDDVEKPDLEHRNYRHIVLPNQLEIVIVSDPICDYAAAALEVGVGSQSDPEELPGLAHFLEHMLFLGTEKYPKEDEYTSYIQQHGGMSNAFTTAETTVYYFDVQQPYLEGAIDRFAQFFLCPLFTESCTYREINAVDSENAKNLQANVWRMSQLEKSSADPRHPFSRFHTGNAATLGDGTTGSSSSEVELTISPAASGGGVSLQVASSAAAAAPAAAAPAATSTAAAAGSTTTASTKPRNTRAALIDFHSKWYSANLMRLSVLGRGTLDELEALLLPLFGNVPNKSVTPPEWPFPPFPEERLKRRYKVVPIGVDKALNIAWPIPPIRGQYLSKPFRYVSHILGHESAGSLLSLLKARGWADELMAGETKSASDFAQFGCQVQLTDEGDLHADEIVELIFATISMISSKAPQRWVFDEMRDLGEIGFRFKDSVQPDGAVSSLAQDMRHYPPSMLMSAPYKYTQWEPQQVTELLGLLTPERSLIYHISDAFEGKTTQNEPWYGTAYSEEPLSDAFVERCKTAPVPSELFWPDPNPFVPKDFNLACDVEAVWQTEREKAAASSSSSSNSSSSSGGSNTTSPPSPSKVPLAEQVRRYQEESNKGGGAGGGAGGGGGGAVAMVGLAPPAHELTPPCLIRCDRCADVWQRTDATFRRPKTRITIEVTAPAMYASPANAMYAQLYNEIVDDELNEFYYPATLAGVSYSLARKSTGLTLVFRGYSDTLPTLIEHVVSKLATPALEEKRYDVRREMMIRNFANHYKAKPLSIIRYEASYLLEAPKWHILSYIDAFKGSNGAEKVSHPKLLDFAKGEAFSNSYFSVHVHGNTTRYQANAIVGGITNAMPGLQPISLDAFPRLQYKQLPTETEIVLRMHQSFADKESLLPLLDEAETNSAVVVLLQGDLDARPASVITELLGNALAKDAFEQLRTREQLGYIVGLNAALTHGVWSIQVLIQSSVKDAAYLDERAEAFLSTVPTLLSEMTDETFEDYRQSYISNLLEPPKSSSEEASLMWAEIGRSTYDFKRSGDDADLARKLTKEDLLKYWHEVFAVDAPKRRKLSAQFFAPNCTPPPRRDTGAGGLKPALYLDGLEAVKEYRETMPAWPAKRKDQQLAALRLQYHARRRLKKKKTGVAAVRPVS